MGLISPKSVTHVLAASAPVPATQVDRVKNKVTILTEKGGKRNWSYTSQKWMDMLEKSPEFLLKEGEV